MKEGVDYKPIPYGTPVEDVVKDMKLIYVNPKYEKWKKEIEARKLLGLEKVHWSGYINKFFLEDLKKDPSTMAIWKKDDWLVIAWVETEPKKLSKEEFVALFGKYLEPEHISELLGGYYDYDTMNVRELGIKVEVTPTSVWISGEDWNKLVFEGKVKE